MVFSSTFLCLCSQYATSFTVWFLFHTPLRIPLKSQSIYFRNKTPDCTPQNWSELPSHSRFQPIELSPVFHSTFLKTFSTWLLVKKTAILQFHSRFHQNALMEIFLCLQNSRHTQSGWIITYIFVFLYRNFKVLHFSPQLKPVRNILFKTYKQAHGCLVWTFDTKSKKTFHLFKHKEKTIDYMLSKKDLFFSSLSIFQWTKTCKNSWFGTSDMFKITLYTSHDTYIIFDGDPIINDNDDASIMLDNKAYKSVNLNEFHQSSWSKSKCENI